MRDWINRLRPTRDRAAPPEAPQATLPFSDVEGVLALYATALSGGTLRITSSTTAARGSYADGRTIFLPRQVDIFPTLAEARRLYRLMVAWKVVQCVSGSLDVDSLSSAGNSATALACYEVLHGEWLDRKLVTRWPGLAPDLTLLRADALRRSADGPQEGEPLPALLRHLLTQPVQTSLDDAALDQAGTVIGNGGRQAAQFRRALQAAFEADSPESICELAAELAADLPATDDPVTPVVVHYRGRIRLDIARHPPPDLVPPSTALSRLTPPARRRGEPLVVDGRVPDQRRNPGQQRSRGGRQAVQISLGDREPPMTFHQVPLTEAEKAGASRYHEWDYRREEYLPEWCAVRERQLRAGSTERVDQILRQNAPLVRKLKQQFEILRPERLRLTRQLDGDDLDLNAIVEAYADRHAGISPGEELYSRTLERERNIALGCLVDLSGSTGAWVDDDPRNEQVIEITRRSLVFLSEALTVLDDRYAMFGFTSSTRKRCDISVIKGFVESYGETVRGRIAGLAPGSYTRIGPAIRHTAAALIRQPARVRLLLLISDGRPNDFDGYGGRYGVEDTRRALIEARQSGVRTFALTIDAEARDYMPYMFGRSHYLVVEDAPGLATKLSDVYRRLTLQ